MNTYEILILTETWLTPEIYDSEFIDQRYTVFRCDRDRIATNKQDGGGVLVAILSSLKPSEVDLALTQRSDLSHNHIEHLIVELQSTCNTKQHIVSAAYIPPKTPLLVYNKHLDTLQEVLSHPTVDSFYILGDYNLPEANWLPSPVSVTDSPGVASFSSVTSATCAILYNLISLLGASQLNSVVNDKGKILDLVISNNSCTVSRSTITLLPIDIYHPALSCETCLDIKIAPLKKIPLHKYNFLKANFDNINCNIQQTNWTDLLSFKNSEDALTSFYEELDKIIRQDTPLARARSVSYPVWFSRTLITISKKKHKAWVKWKKFQNISDYNTFASYRGQFKDTCLKCFNSYIRSVEDSLCKNIKHFWTYISNRKEKPGIPAKLQYKNSESNDPISVCNMFSDFFYSVFEPASPSLPHWTPPLDNALHDTLICDISFGEDIILKELESLDVSKGPGPDGLSPYFLKNAAVSICKPLFIIYNKCMLEGVVPKQWKDAFIVPVHKGGSRRNVEHYRPISVLSALSKLFERLVHNAIYPILHNIIVQQQHGFVKRRSTVTNLLLFTSFLFDNVDSCVQVDAVYTDFCKAFDKVDHVILLNKLAFNGIRGNLLRWFASYITNRSQRVVVNGHSSCVAQVTSGVPQGSILGPLLFVLYINDISQCFLNTKFLLYADDLKVYRTVRDVNDCLMFQQDLDRLSDYCRRNKLQLSLPKCNYLNFTKNKNIVKHAYSLCDAPLTKVDSVRDLGIILDSKLCLDSHISKIVNKAYQLYGFVMRSTLDFKKSSSYMCLYKSLVRSQLEYAVSVWSPYYKKYIDAIERVQQKFLRAMHFRCYGYYLPYQDLLKKYKLTTLESRRKYLMAMNLYNIVRNRFDCIELTSMLCYVVPRTVYKRKVRAGRLFSTRTCHSNTGLRSPVRRMIDAYNMTFENIDIFACSLSKFKCLVLKELS